MVRNIYYSDNPNNNIINVPFEKNYQSPEDLWKYLRKIAKLT